MEIHLQNGEPLDLPPDLQLSVSQQNPLLSEQGTYSLQVSLPASPRNIRLLSHPDRLEAYYKFSTKAPAFVKQGLFQKKATMCLLEGGGDPDNDDIDATFLMNESELYAAMKETQLSAAFAIKRQASEFLQDMTFADDIDRLVKYLELVKVNNIEDDFLLFEVGTDKTQYTVRTPDDYDYTYPDVFQALNEEYRNKVNTPSDDNYDTDLYGNIYTVFRGRYPHKVYLNNEFVDVPKGYGITPFLRLQYVLRHIFEYFGYRFEGNLFDTDPDMKLIVVINNTADVILKGVIDYAQLVPSGTVHEFLDNIRQAFACEFFVSEDNRTVNVKFWNDILSTIRMERDYTPFLSGIPRIKYTAPKTIKLTFKRSLDSSEVPYSTLDEFEEKFGVLTYIESLPDSVNDLETGFYFVKDVCQIWEVYMYDHGLANGKRIYSRPLFDYYAEDNLEFEEKECNIEYVPSLTGVFLTGLTNDPGYSVNYRVKASVLYIGERRHMNTVLEKTSGQNVSVVKETAGDCPTALLYYRTRVFDSASLPGKIEIKTYGTAFIYDDLGNTVGALDLIPGGDYGLFNTFYKSLDNMLRNSNHQITVPLKLPEAEIAAYRNDRLICVNNQPLLPDTLEYIVGEKNIDVNKATFRTVRPYFDRE